MGRLISKELSANQVPSITPRQGIVIVGWNLTKTQALIQADRLGQGFQSIQTHEQITSLPGNGDDVFGELFPNPIPRPFGLT